MQLKMKITVLSLMMLAAAGMSIGAVKAVKPADPQPETTLLADSQPESSRYYLRDAGGFVAVFGGDNGTVPLNVTDIETETLNDVDRELLRAGIPAENKTALLTLLEDLGS